MVLSIDLYTKYIYLIHIRRKKMSRTNIDLDDRLVREGMRCTGLQTKRALVHAALENFVRKQRLRQYFEGMAGVLKTRGKVGKSLLKERKRDRVQEDRT